MIEFTAERYVEDVLGGRVPACRWVRLACERHVRDLEEGHKRGLWFDERAAQTVIAFFSLLHHWKGEWAGSPIFLEPAQQFWVWSIFGWYRDDGSRRFRTAYLEVARKNGKTTFAAGCGLYLAFVEGEPGAEVYAVATKRDQARIAHRDATEMVRKSPDIKREVGIFRDNIHHEASGSKFEPLSSDYNTLDGLNVHGGICDELHAWKSGDLWGVIRTGMGSRRQPLTLAITTAGVDTLGVCFQQREYVTRLLRGMIQDDDYWGIIYTLDSKKDWPDLVARGGDGQEDTAVAVNEPDGSSLVGALFAEEAGRLEDDWGDEAVWIKANPLLGTSKKWRAMRSDAREARNKPAELNGFLRWNLDLWTQALVRWVNPITWSACGSLGVDEKLLEGRECYAGLDLSQIFDLSALVLVFPPDEVVDYYIVKCYFWLPADNMHERVSKANVPYDVWVRKGFIELTPGNVIDYDFIVAKLRDEIAPKYEVLECAYDRYGATKIAQQLQDSFGHEWVVPMGQGFLSMSPPMKELGVLIASKKLAHGNNEVLNWMADNLVAREDPAGNIKPDKEKSREKIDGMVALIMGLDRAVRQAGVSKYEERDLLVL